MGKIQWGYSSRRENWPAGSRLELPGQVKLWGNVPFVIFLKCAYLVRRDEGYAKKEQEETRKMKNMEPNMILEKMPLPTFQVDFIWIVKNIQMQNHTECDRANNNHTPATTAFIELA